MISGRSVLAVIPARAGSKGLPGKNLLELCGQPLITWSIEQGLDVPYIDALLVSTDSVQIADVAKRHGATVPFIRPNALASDESSSIEVIIHALDFLAQRGESYDYVILLEPTSPLRESTDISGALETLASHSVAKSIVSVAKAESAHPSYLFQLDDGLLTPMLGINPTNLRRQDLICDFYYLEGCVYASTVEALKQYRSFYHDKTIPWIVDRYKAVEIDEHIDFIVTEALLTARLSGKL